jgi:hypothetical protein
MITTYEIKLFALAKKDVEIFTDDELKLNLYEDIYKKCINIIISKNKNHTSYEKKIYISILNYILSILEDLLYEEYYIYKNVDIDNYDKIINSINDIQNYIQKIKLYLY